MNLNFNARTINPNQGSGPKLVPGEYPFVITGDETRDGALWLELTVAPGNQYSGSIHRHRLGLWSQNTDEYRIAWENLSAICHVTGVLDLQDPAQLRGITFYASIVQNPKNDKYNELKKLKDANGRTPNEIAKHVGTVQGQPKAGATAPQVQPVAPPQVYSAPTPAPAPAFIPQAPAVPQVGWPTQQQAPAAPPQFQAPQAAQAPAAPWGAPPAVPTGNPPAWAK